MDIRKLGGLIQSIQIGMSREELETLLGETTSYGPLGNSLYPIDDLHQVAGVIREREVSLAVYLLVNFEGDEERKENFFKNRENVEELKNGLSTDRLMSFAIATIGE